MVDIKPGQVFVPGTSAKLARQLLDGARKAGLNPKLAVRTTEGGFVVPEAVMAKQPAKRTARILPVDPPPEPDPSAAPPRRRRKKNPQKGT